MSHNPYQPPTDPHWPEADGPPPERVSTLAAFRFGLTKVGIVNLLIAVVMMMIPLVGPIALAGWLADVHRRLARGEPEPVERLDFNQALEPLKAGLVPFVAQFIGGMLVGVPLYAGFAIAIAPLWLGFEPSATMLIFSGVVLCGAFAATLLASALLLIPLMIRAELTGSFSQTFDLGAAWHMGQVTWLPAVLHTFVYGVLACVGLAFGLLAFFVGIYVAMAVLYFTSVHFRWQLYRYWLHSGGEPLPIEAGKGATL